MPLIADIHNLRNFSRSEEKKMREAIGLCIQVFNSPEFRERVFNYTYAGVKRFKRCDMSNGEVYDLIMSGWDKFGSRDGDMDIDSTLYFSRKNVIGYTYGNTLRTWINRKYFGSWSPAKISANLAHEYMHNLNFGHAYRYNSTRKHTVPYAIGYIVGDIAKELADPSPNSPAPRKKKRVCKGWWIFRRCRWVYDDE